MHCRGIKTQIKGILKTKGTKLYNCIKEDGVWVMYRAYCGRKSKYSFEDYNEARAFCIAKNKHIKRNRPTIGTELEFEKGTKGVYPVRELKRKLPTFCKTAKMDYSLYCGFELNTDYCPITDWDLKKVRQIMKEIAKYKPHNRYNTAGQHVHVFGPDVMKVYNLIKKYDSSFLSFIYPICGRHPYVLSRAGKRLHPASYGISGNSYRFNSDYSTLEIRAFAASTKPWVIKARLIVCDALYKALAKFGTFDDILNKMSKKGQSAYKRLLLDKDNPHHFGADVATVLTKFN